MEGRVGVISVSDRAKKKSFKMETDVNDVVLNKDLRRKIVDMVVSGNNGHIPSAFSILDIITYIYDNILKFDAGNPTAADRDYFVLSKGHGCLALYVNLHKHGFITDLDIEQFCKPHGRLGEHPDMSKVPGSEASSGSLGHGLSFATGIALGLKLHGASNKVITLIGDGESHEGTVWEAAHVAANCHLDNLCVVVDWNESGMQLLPQDKLPEKWEAFGWDVSVINGHDPDEIHDAFQNVQFNVGARPRAIIARTIKGKGVSFLEGHGMWHHRVPNQDEYELIMRELT